MYTVTERCKRLREIAVHKKTYERLYSLRRVVYYTIGGDMAMMAGKAPDEIVAAASVITIRSLDMKRCCSWAMPGCTRKF